MLVTLIDHMGSDLSVVNAARMVLPVSQMTEWYWSGSLDSFANMCNLRCKHDTQEETRLIAEQVSAIMSELYPHSWKALTNET